jgi:hypothetical protein
VTVVMPGQHLPPDHSRGDDTTIGGYAAVHARPAALEGRDGKSYSLEILADESGDPERPVGAFLLFVQWKRVGEQGVEGHFESEFLSFGKTAPDACRALGAWPLAEAQRVLDSLITAGPGTGRERRWWDVMRDEGAGA